jgi:hypothetical protein
MTFKQQVLTAITKQELLDLGRELEVEVTARQSAEEVRGAFAARSEGTLERLLPRLSRDTLKAICRAVNLPDSGREKQSLVERILAAASGEAAFITLPPGMAEAPPVRREPERSPRTLSLEVEPRKPRLAWQGMDARELAVEVPTQVIEIVRPGRAVDRGELAGLNTRYVTPRDAGALPPNRLIWTNDNLVALQTLLAERDPETREFRYRGKVDLVYIDPPFRSRRGSRTCSATTASRRSTWR